MVSDREREANVQEMVVICSAGVENEQKELCFFCFFFNNKKTYFFFQFITLFSLELKNTNVIISLGSEGNSWSAIIQPPPPEEPVRLSSVGKVT